MKSLRFDKLFIIQRLRENRKKHEEIYAEAVVGYQKKAITMLEERLEKVKANPLEHTSVPLSVPQNHLKEYDRTILMVDQCLDVELELDEQEYSQYIQDNWTWTRTFLSSNSGYSSMAASGCASL
jgi:hypothetical protein